MKYNDICPVTWQVNMMRLMSKMYIEICAFLQCNKWRIISRISPATTTLGSVCFAVLCSLVSCSYYTTALAQNDLNFGHL